jgi:large subunit ribosomal protein L3
MKALIGKKIGMTRIFDQDGKASPVCIVQAGPCPITQIKSKEKEGYNSIQIAYGTSRNVKKPQINHLKKANIKTKNIIEVRDFVFNNETPEKIGDLLSVDLFNIGDKVIITGTSKGKGFAGGVKRHGFTTGPKTHGSCNYRKPGSIGDTGPQRVLKGKRMAGHMGNQKITVSGVKIVDIDKDKNMLVLRGSVPGANNGILYIKSEA